MPFLWLQQVLAMPMGLSEEFAELHHAKPRIFRAPGRVNLIGEHTDYNDGFVLPAAIDRSTWVAASPRPDRIIDVASLAFGDRSEFDLDEPDPKPSGHWSDYVRGVAHELRNAGHSLPGANLLIKSDIPLGAGLSSSAALEVSLARALTALAGIEIGHLDLARICQRVENDFIGLRSGIMDQLIACLGRPGKALFIDCRSLESEAVPVDESQATIILCNTMVKHELAGSAYNERRAECEEAARILRGHSPEVAALRDVSTALFGEVEGSLAENIRCRARHVITENERVRASVGHLKKGDLEAFGHLMAQSHGSLRKDYDVSCRELDRMVEIADTLEGVYGARMTGGGFGGCTVNLVRPDAVDRFCEELAEAYQMASGIRPEIYICRIAGGAEEIREES